MEPVGKRGYASSKIENLNLANQLLAEAQDAYEKPSVTIDDLDFLQEAYEKAQRGYDMLSSINPDAASTITIHRELQKKIWKLQKPPKPKIKEIKTPEKKIEQPILEPDKQPEQQITQTIFEPPEPEKKVKKETPKRRKNA